jgi:hypothetical protein
MSQDIVIACIYDSVALYKAHMKRRFATNIAALRLACADSRAPRLRLC